MPLCRRGGRLTFLLLRQKQSKQKKRRPWCLRPSASLRAPSGARFKRGRARTRFAQTIARPDPLEAPLLSAFTRVLQRGEESESDSHSDSDSGTDSYHVVAIKFIAAYARITAARDQKHLQKRRAAWFWGSDHNFAAKRSAAPEGQAEGAGNLCSDPKNARSRIYLLIERACTLPSPDAREMACSNSRCINAAAIQITRPTSPGFAEVL